jgi:hypothetical protein
MNRDQVNRQERKIKAGNISEIFICQNWHSPAF